MHLISLFFAIIGVIINRFPINRFPIESPHAFNQCIIYQNTFISIYTFCLPNYLFRIYTESLATVKRRFLKGHHRVNGVICE